MRILYDDILALLTTRYADSAVLHMWQFTEIKTVWRFVCKDE